MKKSAKKNVIMPVSPLYMVIINKKDISDYVLLCGLANDRRSTNAIIKNFMERNPYAPNEYNVTVKHVTGKEFLCYTSVNRACVNRWFHPETSEKALIANWDIRAYPFCKKNRSQFVNWLDF